MHVLLRLIVNAAALWAATRLVQGISYSGDWPVLFGVALVFGLLNLLVRPVLMILTFPFFIVTLGLFTLVLNAFMLWLTSALSERLGLGFHVDGFPAAFFGALVVTVVSFVLSLFVGSGENDKKRHTHAVSILVAAVLGVTSLSISAQWLHYPTAGVPRTRDGKPNLSARAPRTADGKPDFSGVWQNDGYTTGAEGVGAPPRTVFFDVSFGISGGPPYQPWAAEIARQRKEENSKDNPDARCLPIGALQMLAHPLPKKIVQVPGLLVILHERNMEFRQIFTDGRPLPDDLQPSWYGYSTGKWDGDTLVVETAGFRDGLWADFGGSPMTDAARMTERFRRPNYGTLEVQVTVDDPKVYTKPWTVTLGHHLGLDLDLLEYACLENEKDVPRLVGK